MNEDQEIAEAPATPAALEMELGRWLGRREAFGLIAGRCSSAEVESLRRLREGKLYQQCGISWEEFCSTHLHLSRRTVDREIRQLERYGPAFFTLRQLTHVTISEYAKIADRVSEDGIRLEGAVIALLPENSEALAGAVETLVKENEPAPPPAEASAFDTLLERLRAATRHLRSLDRDSLTNEQLYALARAMADVLTSAAGAGVVLRSS